MPTATTTPRVWTVFVAYFAVWGAMGSLGGVLLGVALATSVGAHGFSELDPEAIDALIKGLAEKPWFVLASGAISALSLGGAAIVAARLSPTAVVERLRLGPGLGDKRRFAVAPLATVAALYAGSAVLSALHLVVGSKSDVLIGLEKAVRSTGPMFAMTLLVIAVAAPVGEELFFRGYAQTRLVARYGRGTGILVATGLFALLHFDPMHVAVAFAIGAVLAWTTERTGSIRSAIVAHAVNNGLFVFGNQASPEAEAGPSWVGVVSPSAVAVAALVGIGLLTRKRP